MPSWALRIGSELLRRTGSSSISNKLSSVYARQVFILKITSYVSESDGEGHCRDRLRGLSLRGDANFNRGRNHDGPWTHPAREDGQDLES